MSVIAYKAGVMAADSRAYGGGYNASPGSKWKIHRLDDGSLIGLVSSMVGGCEEMLEWVKAGRPITAERARPSACADFMLVMPNGSMFLAVSKNYGDPTYVSGPIKSKCHAIGSGGDYAIGAMHAGSSAEGAVRVACRLDPHCGLPIKSLRL